ncbi:MAG TPA: hypothetical protein O0X50_03850, partial [Methanocorpusculum sp.]|nr:hypothetical protein [Methanocorpusculum sp.]
MIGREDRIREYLPTAGITIQVIQGTDVAVNEEFIYPLVKAMEIIEHYVNAWNPESELQSGLFRISIPLFDRRAFREALVNAVAHRDYAVLGRTRILIDDEGLTISSPGGFVEGVTLDNLLSVEPRARNPCLADALKRIGLAEKTGRGIDRIYEGSILYGRPWPDYSESDSTIVKLFIPRADPDEAFTAMIIEEKNRLGRQLPFNSLLILSALKEERRADMRRIAEVTHLSPVKTKAALERLVETGLAEAIGDGRGRTYMLSSNVYRKTANATEYVRQRDINKIRQVPLILQFVEVNGEITKRDVADLLHVSDLQAYRILKSMVDNGYLRMIGARKVAKYVPAGK